MDINTNDKANAAMGILTHNRLFKAYKNSSEKRLVPWHNFGREPAANHAHFRFRTSLEHAYFYF